MNFQADQSDYKRQLMEQAETEYNQALLDSDPEPVAAPAPVASQAEKDAGFLREVLESRSQLNADNRALAEQNETLKAEISLLKNQSIEKDQKISELEKLALSATSTETETAPVVTPDPAPAARPLTGAAKAAVEKAAAKAAAAATEQDTEETKKNS